jgi:spore coat protein CotH
VVQGCVGIKRLAWLGLCLALGCGDSDEGNGLPGGVNSEVSSASVFNENEISDVHLTMSPADWQSIIADDRGDEYRRCSFAWKSVSFADVAIRPAGHATRWAGNPKQGVKLKFNEFVPGRKFLGMNTLKLDGLIEGTMMRERIAYGVWRAMVPTAPRVAHCRLHVNGVFRGLYLFEERVTDDLLDHRYGKQDGNLYRLMVEVPEAFADRGPNPDAYVDRPFQRESNETGGDHSSLVRFVQTLNQNPGAIGTVCDVDKLTTFLALEVALMSRDGLLRDDGPPQNHYAYANPFTGLFEFIPFDQDQTLTTDRATLSIYHNFANTRIAEVVRSTPALDAQFRSKLAQVVATLTSPAALNPRIDAIHAQIRPHAHEDPNKERSNAEFDSYREYLKRAVQMRYDHIRAELGNP